MLNGTVQPALENASAKPTRRAMLLGVGAVTAGTALSSLTPPVMAQALSSGDRVSPLTRTAPRLGVSVPAIGLGSFRTFDLDAGMERAHLREVMRAYWEGGARVFDTSPRYGTAEYHIGVFAAEMGWADRMIVSDKVMTMPENLGDPTFARRSFQQSRDRLWRRRIDILHCHSMTNAEAVVPQLVTWKEEGLIGAVGVTHHENAQHDALVAWMERGMIDVIQVNYSIANRAAEDRVLRVAADRGIGVMINMPLEKARLHQIVGKLPVPAFAAEFGMSSWAEFFLKWVLANPAVTIAVPSTNDPRHANENVRALHGLLPDAAMRRRMVAHMETIPGFDGVLSLPWFPHKQYASRP